MLERWPSESSKIPSCAWSFVHRGMASLEAGDLDNAMSALQVAVELDPLNSFGHYGLGNVYELRCEEEPALGSYRRAIECATPQDCLLLYKKLALSLLRFAAAARQAGRYIQAVAYSKEAVTIAPDRETKAAAHLELAGAYSEMGFAEKGDKELSKALELAMG